MRKLMLVALSAITLQAHAQKAAKAAYVELGGAGLASANYDMRLMKKNDGLGFRVGVGGFSVKSTYSDFYGTYTDKTGILTIPLELNYLLGKDDKHYFEMGAGATIVSLKEKSRGGGYTSDDDETFKGTFGHLYFGYRIQPKNGGFLFRAGITPVFGKGYFIPYYAGISFGYAF